MHTTKHLIVAAAIALVATAGASNANALGIVSPPAAQSLDLNQVLGFGDAVVPFSEEDVSVTLEAARTNLVPAPSSTATTFRAEEEPEIPKWLTEDTISLEEIARVEAQNPRCLVDSSGCVAYLATNILVEPYWLEALG